MALAINSSARASIPRMQPLQQRHSATKSLPLSLHGGRAAFPFQIEAARKKKSARKEGADAQQVICPVKPPSLFVKQSPVPARRPLRCVPFATSLDLAPQRSGQPSSDSSSSDLIERVEEQAFPAKESKGDKVSKWASLFEAASTTRSSSSSSSGESQDPAKDADAWFDKIFPKNTSPAKEGDSFAAAPKLSAQQEKSIQQLQTLVKTLGVATRSPAPPARRNKPGNKIRQLPIQGAVVDPVPFSSILKKLQSVSAATPAPRLEKSISKDGEDEDEDEDDEDLEDEDDESSEEETESEESEGEAGGGIRQEEQTVSTKIAAAAAENEDREQQTRRTEGEDLAKLTVVGLRAKAKARGLSGYSKMKKGELVQLLRS